MQSSKKKPPLTVRPVRRLARPRYPDWQQPNPLDEPGAHPYPFSQKLLRWLVASGILGGGLTGCATGDVSRGENGQPDVPLDSLRNTFPSALSGLPYQSPGFGTGLPDDLRRREAMAILENLAKKEGFSMQPGQFFEEGGVRIPLDGWDAGRRTGFVFLDWGNSDNMYHGLPSQPTKFYWMKWKLTSGRDTAYRFQSAIEAWEHFDGRFPPGSLDALLSISRLSKNEAWWAASAPSMPERERRKLAFFELAFQFPTTREDSWYDEKLEKEIDKTVVVFPKLEKLVKSWPFRKSPQSHLEWLEDGEMVFPEMAKSVIYPNSPAFDRLWTAAFSMADRQMRRDELSKLLRLVQILFDEERRHSPMHDRIVTVVNNPNSHPTIDLLPEIEAFERETVSLDELKKLDTLAAQGRAFILPLSMKDHRFQGEFYKYRESTAGGLLQYWNTEPDEAKLLDSFEKWKPRHAAEHDTIQKTARYLHRQDMMSALAELEKQARYYLRWAKEQGRF